MEWIRNLHRLDSLIESPGKVERIHYKTILIIEIDLHHNTMAPQAYPKIVKAITSKKLKEPFTPIQAIKICRPKNPGTFRKIFASYRRGNPNGHAPLFIQLKDGTYKAIRPFKK